MNNLINIPIGIYTHCTITNTYSISYPSYRGFSISADSLSALLGLVDEFWTPRTGSGIKSTNELIKAMTNSLEDTAIIDLNKVA